MSEEQKNQVEVEETAQTETKEFTIDGLLPEEIELAKEHGLVTEESEEKEDKKEEDKDGEHEEQSEPETEEDTGEEDKEDKSEEKVNDSFEDIEKDEDKLKKHTPNEQALYWKWKSDKRKRQAAQKEAEEFRAKYELNQVKESAYQAKLRKISELLQGDSVTVESLQSIIGSDNTEDDNAPITKSELKRLEAEKEEQQKLMEKSAKERQARITLAEEIGKSKYDNFDELTKLATEVVDKDKTYRKVLEEAFEDSEVDEEELVERVVTFAKLHPDFGKKKGSGKTEKTNIDRAIKNSKKKISSAAVGHGNSKRVVSYDDLTVEDAARLTTDQWSSLPEEVKQRLLMQ